MTCMGDHKSGSLNNTTKKQEVNKSHVSTDGATGIGLWTDGLIYAFEFVRGNRSMGKNSKNQHTQRRNTQNIKKHILAHGGGDLHENRSQMPTSLIDLNNTTPPLAGTTEGGSSDDNNINTHCVRNLTDSQWIPIGWARISELVQMVQTDASWANQQIDLSEDEDDFTVADVAAPYWERPAGPTWWCHVLPGHHAINAWLSNAPWLHPAISIALRDESRLISDRMKHLLYEVPVRVAGGLLFELLGQSAGDPHSYEDDIPIVLRSWQARNFLITALHVKGSTSNLSVLGITEVQELLLAGGNMAPKSVHELIAHLASRLSRWDDRLFRKFVFGAADEIELKFVNRRNNEDLNLLSIILNQEIKRLATQVIRVKWSLHAREEIMFELLHLLKGIHTRSMLEGINKSTREMLQEQEAVRDRLFTVQDVMQSNVRAWLQDRSLRVTHNLTIFGGCGLVISIITGLFGINVDGIPGSENAPFAFTVFSCVLLLVGIIIIGFGILYLGLKNPITEDQVNVRKLELQQLVSTFQHDAETHAKVREGSATQNLPPAMADMMSPDYILIT